MVICKYPTPCWYARNVQKIVKGSTPRNAGVISLDDPMNMFEVKLQALEKRNEKMIELIEKAPPLTPAIEKTPLGRLYNLITEVPEPFVYAASYSFGNELLIRYGAGVLQSIE
tara:strand:+ start:504 stop:842 length:339 start_codon:yes stop_codon:yes gene_type:complete